MSEISIISNQGIASVEPLTVIGLTETGDWMLSDRDGRRFSLRQIEQAKARAVDETHKAELEALKAEMAVEVVEEAVPESKPKRKPRKKKA